MQNIIKISPISAPCQIKNVSFNTKVERVKLLENIFNEIRDRVSIIELVKFYGFEISRFGMMCCPFHDDQTPSLKVYNDHFYCFGCGATGDCTGFTAKFFGITQFEAAKKINYDFGLNLFDRKIAVSVNDKPDVNNAYFLWLSNARSAVSEYLMYLEKWHLIYAPKNSKEKINPLFIESLQNHGYVEYINEILTYGTEKEKREVFEINCDSVSKIQKRLEEIAVRKRTLKKKAI